MKHAIFLLVLPTFLIGIFFHAISSHASIKKSYKKSKLDFSVYESLLKDPEVKSLEDFFEAIEGRVDQSFFSEDFRIFTDAYLGNPSEIFLSPILFHKGHGIQKASPRYPRLLFSNLDASLLMTASTDPTSPKTLEVIEFNELERRFDFFEVNFDSKSHQQPTIEKNPAKCMGCHGSDPRPIWDTWGIWPEVVGGKDSPKRFPLVPDNPYLMQLPITSPYPLTENENTAILSFLETKSGWAKTIINQEWNKIFFENLMKGQLASGDSYQPDMGDKLNGQCFSNYWYQTTNPRGELDGSYISPCRGASQSSAITGKLAFWNSLRMARILKERVPKDLHKSALYVLACQGLRGSDVQFGFDKLFPISEKERVLLLFDQELKRQKQNFELSLELRTGGNLGEYKISEDMVLDFELYHERAAGLASLAQIHGFSLAGLSMEKRVSNFENFYDLGRNILAETAFHFAKEANLQRDGFRGFHFFLSTTSPERWFSFPVYFVMGFFESRRQVMTSYDVKLLTGGSLRDLTDESGTEFCRSLTK